ncbi:hypothetical protein FLONG3_11397 [Fusarium longipes]|uniref:Uncharacterized protein n=1 Tax=Fusarium longipes TaxID=694270 RepID=A0A395RG29_9HYPO|nr:hypothetical protein FLONG3_11397 [Fusarium longipes]
MLEQYLNHRTYILRKLLEIDFDREMLQDAVRITTLQTRQGILQGVNTTREYPWDWSESRLPDSLKDVNEPLLSQLSKLHSQLLVLTEDYVTKATAKFPPREYLCLPQLHRLLDEGHLMFKGVKVTPRFDSTYLTSSERRRFIKVFLIYELSCRIKNEPHDLEILSRTVTKEEEAAIECVNTYTCSLYGAIIAQCTDTWLPDARTGPSLESGLLFPDNFYFDGSLYTIVLSSSENKLIVKVKSGVDFASLGLKHLTNLLQYDVSSCVGIEALKNKLKHVWDLELRQECGRRWDWWHNMNLRNSDRRFREDYESPMYRILSLERNRGLQCSIYQQRAWPFFDDDRLYHQETRTRPIFPSKRFLLRQPNKQVFIGNWFNDPSRERALRRSQRWHDEQNKTHD